MRRNLGLKIETMSSFGDSFVNDRNSSTPPLLGTHTRRIFEAIERCQTRFGSQLHAHFLLKFLQSHRDLAALDVRITRFLYLKGQISPIFSQQAQIITPSRDSGAGMAATLLWQLHGGRLGWNNDMRMRWVLTLLPAPSCSPLFASIIFIKVEYFDDIWE